MVCPVLIDRVNDLATLQALIDQAKSGRGQVVLLSGEAGIGKSRLVAEIKTSAAAHDFLLVQGICFPTDHAIPYAPLLDFLRSFLAGYSLDMPAPAVQKVTQAFLPLIPYVGHLLPGFPPVSPLPSLNPEQEKRRRFEILADFLTLQAVEQPVFLIVEDLHWSDDTSLEFLHYLARRCSSYPLLLLLTYRSDELRPRLRHFLAQLDRERLAQEVSLARLRREGVEAMLRAIFALPHTTRFELLDPVYTLTDGNPFFVEEILTSLIASGEIYYANDRWEGKPLGELHIPRSVQDAVQQRTDRLSEPARQILTIAAVAGRRFDFVLLQELTDQDEQNLLLLIKEMIAAQLVVEESAEQFAFRHALTRQAIYADLLVRERKALHRRIADTMERLYTPTLEAHLADLAYHFYEAGASEKALAYGQWAGEQAERLYAPHTAIEQVTRALDAAERGSIPPPAPLYRLRGRSYETLGDFEHARLDFETTLQMAQRAGNRRAEWQALCDLGFLWTGRDYTQAGTYFQPALALARHMDDPLTLAHSLNRLGNWHVMNIDQPGEALRYHQEALALFQQAQDQHGIAETYDLLGMTSFIVGDLIQAANFYQQVVVLFQQLDDRQGLTSSLASLGDLGGIHQSEMMVSATISFTDSLYFGEQALQIAREIGQRSAEAYALLALGQFLGPRGEYARALELVQTSLAISKQIEHRQWMTFGHFVSGVLYFDLLALSEAQQHLELALALAALGQTAEAETTLRAAKEAAHAQGLRPWLWRICVAQGRLYQTQGRLEETRQAFASARTIIEELAVPILDETLRASFLSAALLRLPRPRSLTPRRATRQAFGGLTEREREVALLLAEGKSNREIAERLVVGLRTVEVHVSNILSKLGFTSRAQIAVWAYEKGLTNTVN